MQSIVSRVQPSVIGSNPQLRSVADTKSDDTQNTRALSVDETATASLEQQHQIQALKARDSEVRTHEQAHLSAAGVFAKGGASFTFQTGPDAKRYAIGGEVQIDTSPVPGNPQATLRKAEAIRRAALAPASPSSQDYSVAASATSMANNARTELMRQNQQSENSPPDALSIGGRIDIRACPPIKFRPSY